MSLQLEHTQPNQNNEQPGFFSSIINHPVTQKAKEYTLSIISHPLTQEVGAVALALFITWGLNRAASTLLEPDRLSQSSDTEKKEDASTPLEPDRLSQSSNTEKKENDLNTAKRINDLLESFKPNPTLLVT